MRKSFVTSIIFAIFSSIVFFSCRPHPVNTSSCPDCKDVFGSEFKIKKIESFQGGTRKASSYYTYAGNLIDSIYQKLYVGTDSIRNNYKLLYSHCILSGYFVNIIDVAPYRNFKRDVGFILDSNKIIQKIEAQYELMPFNENSLLAKFEYINAADSSVTQRLRRCFPGCLQIGRYNLNHYNSVRNVDTVFTRTDEPLNTTGNVFDNKINPFHRQNGVLYYPSLKPFSYTFPSPGLGFDDDIFDFIELSKNNPTMVTKRTPLAQDKQYTFTYTYNSSDLPTLIQVSVANPISATGFGPAVSVGEVRIDYY